MDLEEARATLFATLSSVSHTESIPLAEALGRVTAEPVYAQISLPPFPASAMDGYAVRREDFGQKKPLRLIGQSLAGHPFHGRVGTGECVRIFTGAVVPEGADLIILQERLAVAGQDNGESVHFEDHEPDESFIRRVGNDVEKGQIICDAGDRLTPLTLGSLASAGVSCIEVVRKVRVGIFSSGDELRDPGTPPEALALGQIYDSNAFTLANLLQHLPVDLVPLQRLADDEEAVGKALADAAERCDMLITSGGVSVGDADFIGATIARLGQLAFWRLNLKPGKPLAFGSIGDCWVFGLPGNPVSAMVTFYQIVQNAIKICMGLKNDGPIPLLKVECVESIFKKPGRTEFQRGVLFQSNGLWKVKTSGQQGSGILSSMSKANCFIVISADKGAIKAGEIVDIQLMDSFI